ncbi:MAG TPA: ATP-binding protein [Edaphobacter sp.]|uniref:sensor histidine kinase n=1 Tax=Edaphobacter sp. TaxID=1934404 RepID=UPI002D1B64EA|nr:ATP-binding protein [Edaphobacter sp.]HUZ95522.1 ATP-binding protein [Edaphobacter sp.]
MLPSSHAVPISATDPRLLNNPEFQPPEFRGPQFLADAFSEFISASSQLEASYRGLQQKVAHLSGELADRNAALTRSLDENSRIRTALEKMIDSLPCGVLVLDSGDAIVTINPEGRRLLGVNLNRVRNLRQLSNASRIDFTALAASQSDGQDTELRLTNTAGDRWVAIGRRELACSPQEPELGGTQLRSIWILRDITATHEAEREREAARRATALAEISSILAHEIRNPLASLELFAELIAQDPGAASQWIAHLRAGIRTLSGTVNNVLSMNGENHLRFAPLDLSECVREAVEFVRPVAEQANVHLGFQPAQEPLTVQGNADGIRQVVLNLVCNAIRHTPAEGRIDVSVGQERGPAGTIASVEVRDTGCGIPEEQKAQLFEAGFSGTGETPGLGLAVCERLMRLHAGCIRVWSQVNKGSRFCLEFPA